MTNNTTETVRERECPFEGCDWTYVYDPNDYDAELSADYASEEHYEREHAGRVRIRVVLEREELLGGRDPQDVASAALERAEEKHHDDVAWTSAEVIEEATDHDKIRDDSRQSE